MELIFKDTSISRIEEILNMLVAVYNENWMKDKNQIMVATSMFINERINIIERELGSVDKTYLLIKVRTCFRMYRQLLTYTYHRTVLLTHNSYR